MPISTVVIAHGRVMHFLEISVHNADGSVKWVTIMCPNCDAPHRLSEVRFTGVDPITCDCGYYERVNLAAVL